MNGTLQALAVYPLKSAAGIRPASWPVEQTGLRDDRRWMLVRPDGQFVTARLLPQLLSLRLEWQQSGWQLLLPDGYRAPLEPDGETTLPVRIWNDRLPLPRVNPELSVRLSRWLEKPVHLVCLPERIVRPVNPRYARPGDRVSLADGFPLLLTRTASLQALNAWLPRPVAMARFRPNLVVDDPGPAWAEEGWKKIRIGEVTFRLAKPCTRCVMVNTDPDKAARDPTLPVLQTLRQHHANAEGEALFGMNLIPETPGMLRVGDTVEILQ